MQINDQWPMKTDILQQQKVWFSFMAITVLRQHDGIHNNLMV